MCYSEICFKLFNSIIFPQLRFMYAYNVLIVEGQTEYVFAVKSLLVIQRGTEKDVGPFAGEFSHKSLKNFNPDKITLL